MKRLTKPLYYPWYEDSAAKSTWGRYLDQDYLKSERQRIERCKEWYKEYRKADSGESLSEVAYYSLPIDLTKGWTKNIPEGYTPKGFSALKNDLQRPIVALFPEDLDTPGDYSLVRVISAEKAPLHNDKVSRVQEAIKIKELEVLPEDHLYKDVPFEKQSVQDILMEGLNRDEFTAKSLGSPLMSSPGGMNVVGGVGMASMLSDAPMVEELFRQLQVMLPPVYRSVEPPSRERKGKWMDLGSKKQKVKFKVAEKESEKSGSTFSTSQDHSYRVINKETKRRVSSPGEYSFVGSVVPKGSNVEVANVMLNKFTQTEITTFHLDKLRQADVDLTKLRDEIAQREDLWLQMVYARQFHPSLEQGLNEEKWKSRIEGDWEAFLPEMGHENISEYVLDVKTDKTWENVKRLAKSRARSDGRTEIKKKDLKEARKLVNTSLEELVSQEETRKARKQIKERKQNKRHSSVQEVLQTRRCTTEELWGRIGSYGYFDDREDLQEYLNWLREKGFVIRDPDRRYRWL